MLKRRHSFLASSSEEKLVQLLICTIRTRMLRIPEAISEPVKRPWIRNGLIRLSPINHVKQVSLNPPRCDLAMRLKAYKMFSIVQKLINEVLNSQFEIAE